MHKGNNMNDNQLEKKVYENIKKTLITARNKIYSTINFEMVIAYWTIGKQIIEAQGNDERAEYGTGLIKYLSERLTIEFGKGFEQSNLRRMHQFYSTYPNCDALRHELSWTHYRLNKNIA